MAATCNEFNGKLCKNYGIFPQLHKKLDLQIHSLGENSWAHETQIFFQCKLQSHMLFSAWNFQKIRNIFFWRKIKNVMEYYTSFVEMKSSKINSRYPQNSFRALEGFELKIF
jgi:hypothetical protein